MSTPKPAPDAPEPVPAKPEPVAQPTAEPKVSAVSSKPDQRIPKSALELRAARRRILQRRYGIWVGLPTLLAIIYYALIAAPQYDSYVLFSVESAEGRVMDATGKAPNAGNLRDARLLREAVRSSQALAKLDKDGAFRKHYQNNGDWLTRLGADGGDNLLDYYQNKITATHEAGTNIVTVRIRAFSGEAAHDFGTKLIEYANTWLDRQNEWSAAARLKQAQADVTRERESLAKAGERLAKIDQPKPTDPASIEHEVAEKRLEAALRGYQEAELEVGRAQRYMVILDGPTQPDVAAAPRRVWGILTVAIGALVLVSVLSLLGASVREHAKF